jgi:hypothetical protein
MVLRGAFEAALEAYGKGPNPDGEALWRAIKATIQQAPRNDDDYFGGPRRGRNIGVGGGVGDVVAGVIIGEVIKAAVRGNRWGGGGWGGGSWGGGGSSGGGGFKTGGRIGGGGGFKTGGRF